MALNRGLVTREPISSSVDKELWQKLKRLHDESQVPLSKLLDEAIRDLLTKREGDR